MAFPLGKSLAMAALASLIAAPETFATGTSLRDLRATPAIVPMASAIRPRQSRKKRRPAPKRTPLVWRNATGYASRRNFAAGRTSTLKKTAKLLRLQARSF